MKEEEFEKLTEQGMFIGEVKHNWHSCVKTMPGSCDDRQLTH